MSQNFFRSMGTIGSAANNDQKSQASRSGNSNSSDDLDFTRPNINLSRARPPLGNTLEYADASFNPQDELALPEDQLPIERSRQVRFEDSDGMDGAPIEVDRLVPNVSLDFPDNIELKDYSPFPVNINNLSQSQTPGQEQTSRGLLPTNRNSLSMSEYPPGISLDQKTPGISNTQRAESKGTQSLSEIKYPPTNESGESDSIYCAKLKKLVSDFRERLNLQDDEVPHTDSIDSIAQFFEKAYKKVDSVRQLDSYFKDVKFGVNIQEAKVPSFDQQIDLTKQMLEDLKDLPTDDEKAKSLLTETRLSEITHHIDIYQDSLNSLKTLVQTSFIKERQFANPSVFTKSALTHFEFLRNREEFKSVPDSQLFAASTATLSHLIVAADSYESLLRNIYAGLAYLTKCPVFIYNDDKKTTPEYKLNNGTDNEFKSFLNWIETDFLPDESDEKELLRVKTIFPDADKKEIDEAIINFSHKFIDYMTHHSDDDADVYKALAQLCAVLNVSMPISPGFIFPIETINQIDLIVRYMRSNHTIAPPVPDLSMPIDFPSSDEEDAKTEPIPRRNVSMSLPPAPTQTQNEEADNNNADPTDEIKSNIRDVYNPQDVPAHLDRLRKENDELRKNLRNLQNLSDVLTNANLTGQELHDYISAMGPNKNQVINNHRKLQTQQNSVIEYGQASVILFSSIFSSFDIIFTQARTMFRDLFSSLRTVFSGSVASDQIIANYETKLRGLLDSQATFEVKYQYDADSKRTVQRLFSNNTLVELFKSPESMIRLLNTILTVNANIHKTSNQEPLINSAVDILTKSYSTWLQETTSMANIVTKRKPTENISKLFALIQDNLAAHNRSMTERTDKTLATLTAYFQTLQRQVSEASHKLTSEIETRFATVLSESKDMLLLIQNQATSSDDVKELSNSFRKFIDELASRFVLAGDNARNNNSSVASKMNQLVLERRANLLELKECKDKNKELATQLTRYRQDARQLIQVYNAHGKTYQNAINLINNIISYLMANDHTIIELMPDLKDDFHRESVVNIDEDKMDLPNSRLLPTYDVVPILKRLKVVVETAFRVCLSQSTKAADFLRNFNDALSSLLFNNYLQANVRDVIIEDIKGEEKKQNANMSSNQVGVGDNLKYSNVSDLSQAALVLRTIIRRFISISNESVRLVKQLNDSKMKINIERIKSALLKGGSLPTGGSSGIPMDFFQNSGMNAASSSGPAKFGRFRNNNNNYLGRPFTSSYVPNPINTGLLRADEDRIQTWVDVSDLTTNSVTYRDICRFCSRVAGEMDVELGYLLLPFVGIQINSDAFKILNAHYEAMSKANPDFFKTSANSVVSGVTARARMNNYKQGRFRHNLNVESTSQYSDSDDESRASRRRRRRIRKGYNPRFSSVKLPPIRSISPRPETNNAEQSNSNAAAEDDKNQANETNTQDGKQNTGETQNRNANRSQTSNGNRSQDNRREARRMHQENPEQDREDEMEEKRAAIQMVEDEINEYQQEIKLDEKIDNSMLQLVLKMMNSGGKFISEDQYLHAYHTNKNTLIQIYHQYVAPFRHIRTDQLERVIDNYVTPVMYQKLMNELDQVRLRVGNSANSNITLHELMFAPVVSAQFVILIALRIRITNSTIPNTYTDKVSKQQLIEWGKQIDTVFYKYLRRVAPYQWTRVSS